MSKHRTNLKNKHHLKKNNYAVLMCLSIMAGLTCITIGTQTKKTPAKFIISTLGVMGASITTRKLYPKSRLSKLQKERS